MTIREFIEHLQTLDPERSVFVIYDSCDCFEPSFAECDEAVAKGFAEDGVKSGDYVMEVG